MIRLDAWFLLAVSALIALSAEAQVPLSRRGGIDLDGLGKSAIVIRSAASQMQAGRLVGGVFQWSNLADPGSSFTLQGSADLDGNGVSDLTILNVSQGAFGDVVTWKAFNPSQQATLRQVKTQWRVDAVGDLDGDGFGDFVWRFIGDDGQPNDTGVSYIWFSNGTNVAQVRKRGGAPLNWTLLGAADLNGDNAADMVYVSPANAVRILMATPGRTCANLSGGTLPAGYTALKFADFTGNGKGDILARNASTGAVQIVSYNAVGLALPPYTGAPDDPNASCTSSSLTVPATTYNIGTADPTWTYYASGDFNGDGIFDVVWLQSNGTLTLWQMNANGAPPTVIANAGTAPPGYSVFQEGGGGGRGLVAAAARAEGVYTGTTSNGTTFEAIILENDQYWALYGLPNNTGGLAVYGFEQASGLSSNGTFTASNVKDFYYTGVVSTYNLGATYTVGQSIQGSIGTTSFFGNKPSTSAYVYTNPAQLSDISGSWTGTLLDGSATSISIANDGTLTGTNGGCSFSGTMLPHPSGKSVFDFNITFGTTSCAFPGQTANGIAIWVYTGVGSQKELIAAGLTASRLEGTVFFGLR